MINKEDHDNVFWLPFDWLVNRNLHCPENRSKIFRQYQLNSQVVSKYQTSQKINTKYVEWKRSDCQYNKNQRLRNLAWWKRKMERMQDPDIECDIKRRHDLAESTYSSNLERIFMSSSVSQKTKLKVFNTYVGSIFLWGYS